MPETVGTLNLKIARLEQHLRLLEKRQALSERYPTYRANLVLEDSQARRQLYQLIQYRDELLAHLAN